MFPVKIKPLGGYRFITGLASNYDSENFPEQLQNQLNQQEYKQIIKHINDKLEKYWSCPLCHYFGWLFSICTCGLSFCLPKLCISDAQELTQKEIKRLNIFLKQRGLIIDLKIKCFQSWIEINQLKGAELELQDEETAENSQQISNQKINYKIASQLEEEEEEEEEQQQ